MVILGSRMRYIRKINGKKQKEIAELLGTTESSVSRYENNKRTPKAICRSSGTIDFK